MGVSTVEVALAALCWGLSGGIGGILMANGWDAIVVSFYRGAIGLLFLWGGEEDGIKYNFSRSSPRPVSSAVRKWPR